MKEGYINFLLRNLIQKRDYIPIRDENGDISEFNGISMLQKISSGTEMLVEVADGDRFSAEAITARLGQHKDILLNMSEGSCWFFEVFIFDSAPGAEKLEAIKAGQYQEYPGKTFLACITVDLSAGTVEKHYKYPFSSDKLEKTIGSALTGDWRNYTGQESLEELIRKKEEELSLSFAAKKPYLTYGLIAVNIIMWAVISIYSRINGNSYDTLLGWFGAKNNFDILSGEYWRFLTPVFLHADEIHLLVNCYSLYAVGTIVERLFGHTRFAVVYFVAGIIGNIASFMFSISSGVGASGAIFGLMGALIYFGVEKPASFRRYFGRDIIITVVINLVYGFSRPGIDNFAHIGGLIGGFFASGAVSRKRLDSRWLNRYVFIVLTAVIALGGLFYGFNNKQNTVLSKVTVLEELGKESKWAEVEKTGEEILALKYNKNNINLRVMYIVIQAEAEQGKFDEAIMHGNEMLKLDPAWGHYILGVMYFNTGEYDRSKEELLEAKKLNAEFDNIDEILNRIESMKK